MKKDGTRFLKIKDAGAIHLRQGELDGACTVYSLMMGLIAAGKVSKNELTDLDIVNKVDGRYGFGRLIREFFYKIPKSGEEPETVLLRYGYTLEDIQNKLAHAFSSYVTSWYASSGRDDTHRIELLKTKGQKNSPYLDKDALIEFIADEIDKNRPVEIAFRYRGGGGHALLAVGYKRKDEEVTSLFCLDPSYEAPCEMLYNVEIKLRKNGKKIQHHVGMDRDVLIDEALSFER